MKEKKRRVARGDTRIAAEKRQQAAASATIWLKKVRQFQQQFISAHGYLPDSTPAIAQDRGR